MTLLIAPIGVLRQGAKVRTLLTKREATVGDWADYGAWRDREEMCGRDPQPGQLLDALSMEEHRAVEKDCFDHEPTPGRWLKFDPPNDKMPSVEKLVHAFLQVEVISEPPGEAEEEIVDVN